MAIAERVPVIATEMGAEAALALHAEADHRVALLLDALHHVVRVEVEVVAEVDVSHAGQKEYGNEMNE